MTDPGSVVGADRFWQRVGIGLAVGFLLYAAYVIYALAQIGHEFQSGLD